MSMSITIRPIVAMVIFILMVVKPSDGKVVVEIDDCPSSMKPSEEWDTDFERKTNENIEIFHRNQ
jgi:hypothetical protein